MCVRVGREGGTHALWLTVPRSARGWQGLLESALDEPPHASCPQERQDLVAGDGRGLLGGGAAPGPLHD